MKIIINTILIFFTLLSVAYSKTSKIKISEIKYTQQAFQNAFFESIKKIDTIDEEDGVNKHYKEIYNKKNKLIGYLREVSTTTGCNSLCKPLNFALALNENLKFRKIISKEPLSKLGHRNFTFDDDLKLDSLLKQPPGIYIKFKSTSDLVDAITMATKKEYKYYVVPTAALSSFRIYQYVKHTIDFLKIQRNL